MSRSGSRCGKAWRSARSAPPGAPLALISTGASNGSARASTRSLRRGRCRRDRQEGRSLMFDRDRFVAECRQALAEDRSQKAVREVVARAVADPTSVLAALGEPCRAGLERIHHAPDLTILNLVWGPWMTLMP